MTEDAMTELLEKLKRLEEENKKLEDEKKRSEDEIKELQKKVEQGLILNEEIRYYTENEITDLKPLEKEPDIVVYTGKLGEWGQVTVKQFVLSNGHSIKIEKDDVAKLIRLEQHPNIVRLYGVLGDKTKYLGYVMEYFEGQQLSEIIYDEARVYELPEICQWVEKIACGLKFLHKEGLVHGEIKPQNVFIAGNQVKLGPSGMTKEITSAIERLRYQAPEVLQGEKSTRSTDIYSLAVTIWEIFHKNKLYEMKGSVFRKKIIEGKEIYHRRSISYAELCEMGESELKKKIIEENLRPGIDNTKMDQSIGKLIELCWHSTPSSRPELQEIVDLLVERARRFTPKDLPHYKMSDFKIDRQLGSGTFGSVSKGYDRNNEVVAIKNFINMDSTDEKYCDREIQILKKHLHPNIVELLGVIWYGKMLEDGKGRLYDGYVMKYMELGSLDNVIHNDNETYDVKLIATWINQICLGLQYLHANFIIHRDIKPPNILLAARDHIKLADFGVARNSSIQNTNTSGNVGTEIYRAPEVFISSDYGPLADVYSLGVTIWEIIHKKNPRVHMKRNSGGDIIVQIPDQSHEFEVFTDLVKRCLEENPVRRLSIIDIFDSPLMRGFCKTILIMTRSRLMGVLSPDRSKWVETIVPKWGALSGGAVLLGDEIYLVGGYQNEKCLYKLDKNLKRTQLADMNIGRIRISNSCVEWNGYIWVFGGSDHTNYLKSVERYDPKTDKWTEMPDMIRLREDAAATVWNDRIIVSGGDTTGHKTLNSVECFNPKDGSWMELTNMPNCLRGHSLVCYKNKIIAMGGQDGRGQIYNTVYELDPIEENPKWKLLSPMKYPAYFFNGIVHDDKIFAIGGLDSNRTDEMDRVEIFDGKQWRDGPTFPIRRSNMWAIIIPQYLANHLCNYKKE